LTDIFPCDFWVFDIHKAWLNGKQSKNGQEVLDAMLAVLSESTETELLAVDEG
jgi:hypothetical protein